MILAKKMLLQETCEFCAFYTVYECTYWAEKALKRAIENDSDEFDDVAFEDNVEDTTPNSSCEKFERRQDG